MLTIELRTEVTNTASSVLSRSPVRDLRRIRVDGKADHLKLSGKVRSYYHKQLAHFIGRSGYKESLKRTDRKMDGR